MATSPLGTCFFRFGGKGWEKQVPLGLVFSVFWGQGGKNKSPLVLFFFSPPAGMYQVFCAFLPIFDCRAVFFSIAQRQLMVSVSNRCHHRPSDKIRNCGWARSEQQSSACASSVHDCISSATADGHAHDWISSATSADIANFSHGLCSIFRHIFLLIGGPHYWSNTPMGNEIPCGFLLYT